MLALDQCSVGLSVHLAHTRLSPATATRALHEMARGGFYAVAEGRKRGIFTSWAECEAQIKGYSGSVHKKFPTSEAAQAFLATASPSITAVPSLAQPIAKRDASEVHERMLKAPKVTNASGPSGKLSRKISVYCDGAATGNGTNGSAAGWGVWFADEGPLSELNESRRLTGSAQTNNRAELMAIIRAIQISPTDCELTIHTDSQYSIQAINSWQYAWRAKKWRRSNGEVVQNRDLIRRLECELRARPIRPVLKYVKGHAGIHGNEMANRLATHGATLPAIPTSEWQDLEPSDSETEKFYAQVPKFESASCESLSQSSSQERDVNGRAQSSQEDEDAELLLNIETVDEDFDGSVRLETILPREPTLTSKLRKAGFTTLSDITDEVSLQGELVDSQGRHACGVHALASEIDVAPSTLALALRTIRAWNVTGMNLQDALTDKKMVSAVARLPTSSSLAAPVSPLVSQPPRFPLSHLSQKFGDRRAVVPTSNKSPQHSLRHLPAPSIYSQGAPPAMAEASSYVRGPAVRDLASIVRSESSDSSIGESKTMPPQTPLVSASRLLEEMPPPVPDVPAIRLTTGLVRLDDALLMGERKDADAVPSATAVEIIGPTASGKTRLGLQLATRCRAEAMFVRSISFARHEEDDVTTGEREDFNQCVIIDTEGSLSDEIVEEAIEASITSSALERGLTLSEPERAQVTSDALDGIYLVRAATVAELMSLLHLLLSPSPAPKPSDGNVKWPVPPLQLLSAVLIDSLSYLVRDPVDSPSDRAARRYVLSVLMDLRSQLHSLNPRTNLIATNQMTLKMFTTQGDLVNYRTAGAIARLVPQIDLPGEGQDGYGHAWNGVEESLPGSGLCVPTPPTATLANRGDHSMSSQSSASMASGCKEKGRGIFGEAAKRLLLFRDGAFRYAQLIYPGDRWPTGSSSWVPFAIDESSGCLIDTVGKGE